MGEGGRKERGGRDGGGEREGKERGEGKSLEVALAGSVIKFDNLLHLLINSRLYLPGKLWT